MARIITSDAYNALPSTLENYSLYPHVSLSLKALGKYDGFKSGAYHILLSADSYCQNHHMRDKAVIFDHRE